MGSLLKENDCYLPSLNEGQDDVQRNVELQRVGEEDCQRHHNLYQGCQTEEKQKWLTFNAVGIDPWFNVNEFKSKIEK